MAYAVACEGKTVEERDGLDAALAALSPPGSGPAGPRPAAYDAAAADRRAFALGQSLGEVEYV